MCEQELRQRYRNQISNKCRPEDWERRSLKGYFWYGYKTNTNGIATVYQLNTGKERKIKLNYCSLPKNFYRDKGLDTTKAPDYFYRDRNKSFITFDLFENKKWGKLLQTHTIENLTENFSGKKEPYTVAEAQRSAERWANKYTNGIYQSWKIYGIWKPYNALPKYHAQVDDKILSVEFTPYANEYK